MLVAGVRRDLFNRVTSVDRRLKDLHFLTSDPSTIQPTDQLFGFPREHRPDDHLYPTRSVLTVLSALFGVIESEFFDHKL
jgi:hypothetical protein